MFSAKTEHYAVEVVLDHGERHREMLVSDSPEACLKDFYHLLLDAAGDRFREIHPFVQWKKDLQQKYNLSGDEKLDERIISSLVKDGLLTAIQIKKPRGTR
jgi:hypothetical protein